MPRPRSRVVAARKAAHRATVLLGDVRALQTDRVPQRVVNRIGGRGLSRLVRRWWL